VLTPRLPTSRREAVAVDPNAEESIVGGLRTLKDLLIVGFVAGFVVIYFDFIWDIWHAKDGVPPRFNDGLIAVAGSLAGVLGSAFALALGIAKPGARREEGAPAKRFEGISIPITVGIWAYATIGAAAVLTAVLRIDETPDVVKALSSVFAGYILALASTAFRAIRPG
jgi:hypothetical protein